MATGIEAGGDDQVDPRLFERQPLGDGGRRAQSDDAAPPALRQNLRRGDAENEAKPIDVKSLLP